MMKTRIRESEQFLFNLLLRHLEDDDSGEASEYLSWNKALPLAIVVLAVVFLLGVVLTLNAR